jgi:hypothetical protein
VGCLLDHPAVRSLCAVFDGTRDRHEAHRKLAPLLSELSGDRRFLHDAFRALLTRPHGLERRRLTATLFESGDISIALHFFAPLRDGARLIAGDNIHHHGWRILTSAVVCGSYHYIDFARRSHENRDGAHVGLKIERVSDHGEGSTRMIDSYVPHVVFRPDDVCCTLAVWSSDHVMINQAVKRRMAAFPRLRSAAVRTAHFARLGGALGLNAVRGIYFRPEGGRIIEAHGYRTPEDGEPSEVLPCILRVMQRTGFDDAAFLKGIARDAAPPVLQAIKRLSVGQDISAAVWGDWRTRFSETQILQALELGRTSRSDAEGRPKLCGR